jgi:hypothetical protein
MKVPETLAMLDEAEKLVDVATGSYAGAARDFAGRIVGLSTDGSEAIAQLAPIGGKLLANVERFEGPQSDRDVEEYRRQAGKLADNTTPPGDKKAAIQAMRMIANRYKYVHGERRMTKDGREATWDTTVGKWRVD